MKRVFPLALAIILLLCACGTDKKEDTAATTGTTVSAVSDEDMFTNRDQRTEYEAGVAITLNGSSVSCQSSAVKVDGTTVTITDEGTYVLSGTLNDGRIVVDAEESDKPQLVLNGVSITSAASAALYVLEGDKVVVTLAEGTSNTLANGGKFVAVDDNDIDAAVFSKQDLTFNGSGSLTVTSPAGHGIVCKDDLVFAGGTYTVTAVSHGVDANDSIRVASGAFTVEAGKDGFHAENNDDASLGFVYLSNGTFTVKAEGDGISAGAYLQIENGSFDIVAGGGSVNGSKKSSDGWGGRPGMPWMRSNATDTAEESSTSMKGLKAAGTVLINGGTFTVDAADDAVHADTSLTMNGGTLTIKTGDDGFHAEETLTVNAGAVTITESYEGLEALHIVINGGTVTLTADDDGLNAAGGNDSSGFTGGRDGMFGSPGGKGDGGGISSSSNGSIVIAGGTLSVTASGDGIDANGTLEITGGHTTVCGPTQGDTATLDYDKSAVITGGTFIGTGAARMAQSFSGSKQGVLALSVGNQVAGTELAVKTAAGKTLLTHTPSLPYAVVIVSSPDIQSGKSYTVQVGDQSGSFTAE